MSNLALYMLLSTVDNGKLSSVYVVISEIWLELYKHDFDSWQSPFTSVSCQTEIHCCYWFDAPV